MNPESWKHSECDSLSITDALVSHSTALSLFLLWVLHSPFFFQPGLFLLLFIPDYSPFQELSLTVLTMAPLLDHLGGPPCQCFSVSTMTGGAAPQQDSA